MHPSTKGIFRGQRGCNGTYGVPGGLLDPRNGRGFSERLLPSDRPETEKVQDGLRTEIFGNRRFRVAH